jgi:hypothetical protein
MELETAIQRIESIFYDYAQGKYHLEITQDELMIISKRIVTEVMGINDDNAFVDLKDISK